MKTIQQITLEKAVKQLNAIGAKYIIIEENGNKVANIAVETLLPPPPPPPALPEIHARTRTQKPGRRFGELVQHYRPFIEHTAVGQVATVPADKFDLLDLQGAVSAWASQHWGKGNHTTTIYNGEVQILRMG
jgi:hypothetical protein